MRNLLFILLAMVSLSVFGQTPLEVDLNKATTEYLTAFVNKDVDALVAFNHPKISKMGGGEEFVRKDVEIELSTVEAQGFNYIGGDAYPAVKEFEMNNEKFYIVPHTWVVEIAGKKYLSKSNILASTGDNGETWHFINIEKYNSSSLPIYFPDFDKTIELPKSEPFQEIRE